ncbi:hypothetical protein [Paenibacillus illinoisensis]|uniref:hypothetical protein n=1 Tax=Paenibacillus illinoisensis TaxID=59845 RepID=UPI003019079C
MKNRTKIKVPLKYQPMIEEVDKDSDGYWAYSKPGFKFADMECHTAHEDSQVDLLDVIRSLVPCDCKECASEVSGAAV